MKTTIPPHPTRRLAFTTLLALFACAPLASVQAQGSWPTKPVRIVVPFAPGGSTDVTARLVAEAIAPKLGQPV